MSHASSTPADASPECTIVVPVYRNAENIGELVGRFADLHRTIPGGIRVVCVDDGSPDDSMARLVGQLKDAPFAVRLVALSRNFGSFAAIRAGLAESGTEFTAVMAADLQEPAGLFVEAFAALREKGGEACDVVLAAREGRADPWADRAASMLFWRSFRRLVQPDMPSGGVDVFACNRAFREHLLRFSESNTSLVGQLFWLGFRRRVLPYHRQARRHGRSAWTFGRKARYLADSVFAFSDLPIRVLLGLGMLGLVVSVLLGSVVAFSRLMGWITVPGYAATLLTVLFFSALNLFGLGIIGSYVWRAYENTKARPLAVVMRRVDLGRGAPSLGQEGDAG